MPQWDALPLWAKIILIPFIVSGCLFILWTAFGILAALASVVTGLVSRFTPTKA